MDIAQITTTSTLRPAVIAHHSIMTTDQVVNRHTADSAHLSTAVTSLAQDLKAHQIREEIHTIAQRQRETEGKTLTTSHRDKW